MMIYYAYTDMMKLHLQKHVCNLPLKQSGQSAD